MNLITDLRRSLAQLGDARFVGALLKALLATIVALAAVFWGVMLGVNWLLPEHISLPWIGTVDSLDSVLSWAAVLAMIAFSVVLMVPAAAIAVGFFLDDVASAVEAKHYPWLPPAPSMPLLQQITDSLRFFGLVVAANLGALVIYLMVPPLAPFVFWAVNGYLIGREYFGLVAMRRLGPEGARQLWRRHALRVWIIGTALVLPMSIPIINLLAPLVGVAVFTHQFHRLTAAG